MHTQNAALESMLTPVDGQSSHRGQKRPHEEDDDSDDDQAHDEVRLWEDGFKDRYYESKFDASSNDLDFRYFKHYFIESVFLIIFVEITWHYIMSEVYVGSCVTTIKAVLPGNGIFRTITPHLLQILFILQA